MWLVGKSKPVDSRRSLKNSDAKVTGQAAFGGLNNFPKPWEVKMWGSQRAVARGLNETTSVKPPAWHVPLVGAQQAGDASVLPPVAFE